MTGLKNWIRVHRGSEFACDGYAPPPDFASPVPEQEHRGKVCHPESGAAL